ncbi:unnamed protein product, partial [Ectocarpus sp. 8 AP-2014]
MSSSKACESTQLCWACFSQKTRTSYGSRRNLFWPRSLKVGSSLRTNSLVIPTTTIRHLVTVAGSTHETASTRKYTDRRRLQVMSWWKCRLLCLQ